MFHFPWFPSTALCVQTVMTRHDPCRVLLFGNPRINACLAASRGLSQPATSFIGFQRQGIHRVPFSTCRDDARARYGVLKVRVATVLSACPHAHGRDPQWSRVDLERMVRETGRRRPSHMATKAASKVRDRILQSCTVCPMPPTIDTDWS